MKRILLTILLITLAGSSSASETKFKNYFLFVIDGSGSLLYQDELNNKKSTYVEKLNETEFFAKNCDNCIVDIISIKHSLKKRKKVYFTRYNDKKKINKTKVKSRLKDLASFIKRAYRNSSVDLRQINGRSFFTFYGHRPNSLDDSHGTLTLKGLSGVYSLLFQEFGVNYDLSVLSTCNGGTPEFLKAFKTSEFVVSSPTQIHLSLMQTKYLLGFTAVEIDSYSDFQNAVFQLAEKNFNFLSKRVRTEVAISIYAQREIEYLEKYMSTKNDISREDYLIRRFVDCSEQGVDLNFYTFYKPKQFSLMKKRQHSGISCPLS